MDEVEHTELKWLPCPQVVSVLGAMKLGAFDLLEYAADGLVRSRAMSAFYWHRTKDERKEVDHLLDQGIWRDWLSSYQRSKATGDTRAGTFEFKAWRGTREQPVKLVGVDFALDDLEQVFPGFAEQLNQRTASRAQDIKMEPPPAEDANETSTAKARGGAPRETEKWEAVALVLLRLAVDGKLDRALSDGFTTQASLRRAILDDTSVQELGVKDETIKPFISKVWWKVIEKSQ